MLCPTYSRYRPDQRLLEEGHVRNFILNLIYFTKKKRLNLKIFISLMFYLFSQIDEAGQEKYRLEEKQRASRRKREGKKETWEPR